MLSSVLRSSLGVSALGRTSLSRCYKSICVKVPTMGESITEGTIQTWKKNAGERVERDDVIAIIDTDKVSVDVNAPEAGWLEKLVVNVGENVEVGADLCFINTDKPTGEAQKPAQPKPAPVSKQTCTGGRSEKKEPMTRMRRTIADRLKGAQKEMCMLTTFQECDMSKLMNMRKTLNAKLKAEGKQTIGIMPFFLRASARALEKFEMINASIANEGGAPMIVKRNYVDISIAVSTDTGLIVPVIQDANKKTLEELENKIKGMRGGASGGSCGGGNFTITNGGSFGSLFSTPIVNPPQSAILGLNKISERPVVADGKVVIKPMMYLALTYDHRIVDGKESILFLKEIADQIENPQALLD